MTNDISAFFHRIVLLNGQMNLIETSWIYPICMNIYKNHGTSLPSRWPPYKGDNFISCKKALVRWDVGVWTFFSDQPKLQKLCFLPPNIVLGLKKNESKNYFGSDKNFGPEKDLGKRKFLFEKNFCLKKFLVWKIFGSEKNVGSKKLLGPKKNQCIKLIERHV